MKLFTLFCSLIISFQISSQTPSPYPDNSPSIEDFNAMGLPSCDQVWSYKDYQKSIEILDQIYEADKFSLPRLNSQYSGKIFERMMNPSNFAFLEDQSINIGKRIIAFEELKKVPSRLAIYYVEDNEDYERFGAELLECYLLDSYVYSLGKSIYEELKIQLGDRAESISFKQGYEALNLEYISNVERLFQILESDYYRFNEESINTFGNKLFFFASNINNESIRKELRLRLKMVDRSNMTASVKEIIQELKQQL